MARTELRTLFDEIPDPRAQRTRRHRLTDVLVLVLLGKQIAIDGKSIRGTLEAANAESALHVVNAWVCEHQMVLGQYATDVKSNERGLVGSVMRERAGVAPGPAAGASERLGREAGPVTPPARRGA